MKPDLTKKQEDKLFWGLWLTTEIFIPDEKKTGKGENNDIIKRNKHKRNITQKRIRN